MSSLKTGVDYYWKKSDSWDWFGTTRWWEYFVEILGMNGSGGYWIRVKARWNGSEFIKHLDQVESLNWEKSKELEDAIYAHKKSKEMA